MKVAVTGANGHVGACLVRLLLKEGHEVRVLVHTGSRALYGLNVEIVNGSLDDAAALESFCSGREVIFHLAAKISIGRESYDEVYKVNMDGTKNLAAAARKAGVKRFIHFSSIHALQQFPQDKPLDETRPLALYSKMVYEKTKAFAEKWMLEQNSPGFQVVVLNPTAIVGPYDFKPSYLGQVIQMIYKGTLPGLVHAGYNWVDVRDVTQAAVNAMEKGEPGEHYLLSGKWQSLKTLAGLVCAHRNKKCRLPIFPFWLARMGVPFMALYAQWKDKEPLYTKTSLAILQSANQQILNDKARRVLGFSPRPLEESVADTLEWFKKHQYL
ncbi:MAG: NAD-dependent epimerase/dehydratase family protein [Chlorobi bacterium]|nr:NAD-dependent epimerase/dehydratase family protein [Chlorobiota bacterium]